MAFARDFLFADGYGRTEVGGKTSTLKANKINISRIIFIS